jgi:copper(I)-binding protein
MHRRSASLALATALALGLAACGADGGVTAEDVRARAQVESVGTSAIYLDITNEGEEDVELVAASVPAEIAGTVELHETRMADEGTSDDEGMSEDEMSDEDGMSDEGMADDGEMEGMGGMQMVQVEGIPVPAGETVNLEPGGLHIMLFDLAGDLEDGQSFEVTLEFDDGTTLAVEAEVTDSP